MFRSFYLAGFECATGYNMHGEWIDQIAATEHDLHVEADYDRLAEVGIHAVREAIRWPLVDRAGRYDFSSVEPFVKAAIDRDFDVIWDLFHFGYPDDANPFDPAFVERFATYCHAAASYVTRRMHRCFFTPINEPSYFAWAAGEVGRFAPHARGRGFELKVALAKAALAGIAAIRAACPHARIVNVDPICRVVPDGPDPQRSEHARRFNEAWVFEFWDIVSGEAMPELGGSPQNLDIVGLNYYLTNQWQLGTEAVPLADEDPRRVPLSELVRLAWRRYKRDIVITETSAMGMARAPWIYELSRMAEDLIQDGVRLSGICLYPILGMPEWHARDQWARMGLWDLEREQDVLQRKAFDPMLEALRRAQAESEERIFHLPRSGDSPIEFYGRLLWQRRHRGMYAMRLYRSDRPQRLWILEFTLTTTSAIIQHVRTAPELRVAIEHLESRQCAEIAQMHGATLQMGLVLEHRKREDLAEIRRNAREFECVPVSGRHPVALLQDRDSAGD